MKQHTKLMKWQVYEVARISNGELMIKGKLTKCQVDKTSWRQSKRPKKSKNEKL